MRKILSVQAVTPAEAGAQKPHAERGIEKPGFRLPPE
jgi:hypothetical protein